MVVPATQAPATQDASHVRRANLAVRNLSIELDKFSRGRPDAAAAAREAFEKLEAAIRALELHPRESENKNKHASENAHAVPHADAFRRIVQQEVRAELQAAKESIAAKTAQAVLSGSNQKTITSATREAAVKVTKEVTAAAAKEAQRTWASIAAAAAPAPASHPGPRSSSRAPRVVPRRVARQLNIRARELPAGQTDRPPQEIVSAINRHGCGGALASNKLPSGDLKITFEERAYQWYATNTQWVAEVFGTEKALARRTFAVLAKGVHKSLLDADMEGVAGAISRANNVQVFRARPKYFSRAAASAGLLLEFTSIYEANQLCDKGLVWDAGYYPCEVYDGDLRPTICYRCCAYGHKARYCRRTALCPDCAGHKHLAGEECPAAAGRRGYCCPVCKGAHRALDKRCPEYRKRWATARRMLSDRPTHFVIGGRCSEASHEPVGAQPAVHPGRPKTLPAIPRTTSRRQSPSPSPSGAPGSPGTRSPIRRPAKRHRGEAGRPSGLTVAARAPGQRTLAAAGLVPAPQGIQAQRLPPVAPTAVPELPPVPSLPSTATFDMETQARPTHTNTEP